MPRQNERHVKASFILPPQLDLFGVHSCRHCGRVDLTSALTHAITIAVISLTWGGNQITGEQAFLIQRSLIFTLTLHLLGESLNGHMPRQPKGICERVDECHT